MVCILKTIKERQMMTLYLKWVTNASYDILRLREKCLMEDQWRTWTNTSMRNTQHTKIHRRSRIETWCIQYRNRQDHHSSLLLNQRYPKEVLILPNCGMTILVCLCLNHVGWCLLDDCCLQNCFDLLCLGRNSPLESFYLFSSIPNPENVFSAPRSPWRQQ